MDTVNATYALIALLSLGYLLRLWRNRSSTAATHPAGPPPRFSPPGADRLGEYEQTVRFRCAPCERFALVKDLYERGDVDEAEAIYLLECE